KVHAVLTTQFRLLFVPAVKFAASGWMDVVVVELVLVDVTLLDVVDVELLVVDATLVVVTAAVVVVVVVLLGWVVPHPTHNPNAVARRTWRMIRGCGRSECTAPPR